MNEEDLNEIRALLKKKDQSVLAWLRHYGATIVLILQIFPLTWMVSREYSSIKTQIQENSESIEKNRLSIEAIKTGVHNIHPDRFDFDMLYRLKKYSGYYNSRSTSYFDAKREFTDN